MDEHGASQYAAERSASPACAALARVGVHAGVSRLIAPGCPATSRPSLSGEHLLVGLEPFVEELLNRLEKLHAVLFHDDRVRAPSPIST
jgi:hypothetical protein